MKYLAEMMSVFFKHGDKNTKISWTIENASDKDILQGFNHTISSTLVFREIDNLRMDKSLQF